MLDFGFYNMDCMEGMKEIPDNSIDCVVTDCPYRIVSGGCTNDAVKIGRSRKREAHGGCYVGDTNHVNLGGIFDEFDEWRYTKDGKLFKYNEIRFEEWLPEIYRILKNGTHCYIMVNARNLKDLQQAAENAGFIFQNLLVWDKGNSLPNKYYMNSYELILMLCKGAAKNINNMGTSNILRVSNIMRNKHHPTEKPVELMKILIENSTNKSEIVLDPFMGSGSTGIAASLLNREFIGFEIDETYYKLANERIERETAQMNMFQLMEDNL